MEKSELIIYEGAMCCSTGVCGPEPDKDLIEFSEALKRLQSEYGEGLSIMRASLTFNSLIFMAHPEIARLVKENGPAVLPITTINGEIVARQKYLQYDALRTYLEEKINHD
ncbi:MAG: transcriptional regulator [Deltaproteobacteria bacterium RBG_16_58_17]|nr:MAG: transcriptional regulator [Deltaproteobacteria bacterium RBG_16_58_17]OHE16795.1 MAG: transcriptional regulator [Syntrophobacterales bacterium GWC2_56_13]OHE19929.1 MAG: transcriptional regulator [Syntrophobacterales bacterium GWF2_56_9]